MLAAERGAAANTLAAYRRDLESAEACWATLSPPTALRSPRSAGTGRGSPRRAWRARCSALRQFYGFLVDEGLRGDDPSAALPRPRTRRPLPRLLGQAKSARCSPGPNWRPTGGRPEAVRMLALLELLYGSGLRASELVSLPLAAVPRDAPFLTVTGKGGQQRMVPVSGRRARRCRAGWRCARQGRGCCSRRAARRAT